MSEHTYLFTVGIDGGMAFQDKRTMTERGSSYEQAEEKVMNRLYESYSGKVAFFNIIDWKRLG